MSNLIGRVPSTYAPKAKKKNLRLNVWLIVFAVGLVVGSVYLYVSRSEQSPREDMEAVRRAVEKHIVLPSNEEPTLATVTDESMLKDAFLKKHAKTGDKVLVYVAAKMVYIYRPSEGKLAAAGPLIVDPSVAEVQDTRIRIRNGTAGSAKAQALKEKLVKEYPALQYMGDENAARDDYPVTVVIDLTGGEKYNLVESLVRDLGAQRGVAMPAGEPKPADTDVLVLVGER